MEIDHQPLQRRRAPPLLHAADEFPTARLHQRMKLRWIFLAAIGVTLFAVGLGFGVAVLTAEEPPWLTLVASLSAMALVMIPALACLVMANLTFDPESPDGRVGSRRLVLVVAGFEVAAVAGGMGVAIAAPGIAPYAIAVTLLSVALLAVGVRLGGRIRRRTVTTREELPVWSSWPRSVLRRKVTWIVVVFLLVTALATVAFVGLGLVFDEENEGSMDVVFVGLTMGLVAASVACMVVSWPLMKDLRNVLGSGYTEQRAITRVVTRGKEDELSEDGRRRAVVYARIASSYLPFQIAQFALLFGGIWLQQVWSLVSNGGGEGELSAMTRVLVVLYPIFMATFIPLLIAQTRRARRFAAAHAHLMPAVAPDPLAAGAGDGGAR